MSGPRGQSRTFGHLSGRARTGQTGHTLKGCPVSGAPITSFNLIETVPHCYQPPAPWFQVRSCGMPPQERLP
jgi:hypothetical protein